MAKTVTDAFKAVWARKYGRKEILKVRYKRRYHAGSGTYAYESDWQELDQSRTPTVRSISWKLDTPNLNEFQSSTLTLRLADTDHRWLPIAAAPSIFGPDNVASSGYEPYRTLFQVQFGYILDDGTKEYVSLFTGFAEEFRFDGNDGYAEITVASYDRLLREADAENVSDAFTLENCSPATGDGSNREFLTTSTGVGKITVVQVNGVTMTQGTDYQLSQMNETGAAKITFTVAPTSGHTVKATGRKWKANQTIETLIGLLCDEASVTSRTINAAVFPGGLSGSQTIDSQAQWQSGTLTNIDASSSPGSITGPWKLKDNFSDNRLESRTAPGATDWTSVNQNGGTTTEAANGTLLVSTTPSIGDNFSVRKNPTAQTEGSWRFRTRTLLRGTSPTAGDGMFLMFMSDSYSDIDLLTGYGLRWNFNGTVQLIKWSGQSSRSGTVLASVASEWSTDTNAVWIITRTAAGVMTVKKNGVLMATATDNSITTCTEMIIGGRIANSGTNSQLAFTDLYLSSQTSSWSGTWESDEIDLLTTPIAWGVLERTETLNGGTVTYKTKVASSSGGSYDAAVAIASDGTIQSSLKRYLKIVVEFTSADEFATAQPLLDKLIARFSVSTVNLAIANFSGKTCYQAIQRLAQLCDYEWGFNGEGTFFFRSKTVSGSYLVHITQENAIADLRDYRLGFDQVINHGRVRYGIDSSEAYVSEWTSTDAGEASPTSRQRFGDRIREENLSDVIVANDVTLAAARARLIYENNYLPRKRFRMSCRMIPHLDLSDIVRVTYLDRPRDYNPMFGDPLQTWGDSGLGPPLNVLARDMDCKVVGITWSFAQAPRSEIEVQEVLS